MKYITIPEDITLGPGQDGQPVTQSFQQWLSSAPLNGKPFGADGAALRMSVTIEKRFDGKGPGDVVPLEDQEWEKLNSSAEAPEGGFNTPVAKLFIGFMDAVADASEDEAAND